jgi:Zn-dependent protease with chaperone function
LASWLGAAAAVVVELIGARAVPASVLMRSCLGLLRAVAAGAYGQPVRLAVVTLTAAAVAAAGVLAWRLGRAMWRARRATHHHAQLALLTPRRLTPVTATPRPHRVNRTRRISTVVLETAHPAVYCVAGRPSVIVATTAALHRLEPPQLRAVLAHEHAHLAGRHHLPLAFTRSLAHTLPGIRLFTAGATEVARLLEMRADDTAAGRHGRSVLLEALLRLCGAVPASPVIHPPPTTEPSGSVNGPTGAYESTMLGAAGVAVLDRAERLTDPATTAARIRAGLSLGSITVLLGGGPALIWVLTAAGLSMCGSVMG